jgi:hypothetical protein
MTYIFLSALALGVLFLATGCGAEEKNVPEKTGDPNATPEKSEKPATPVLTREQIKDRLQKLSQMPKPKVERGAMCYDMAGPPVTMEYICPKCSEKTLYARANDKGTLEMKNATAIMLLHKILPACRRKIANIRGLAVELDESQFCKKCSPDVAAPKLVLVVRHPNQKEPHRFVGVTDDDLQMLIEFLAGDNKHRGGQDSIRPLADNMPRLEQLLGVKLETK